MDSSSSSSSTAIRALQMELKILQASPVEGFTVTCDDENIFKWTVAIFGPPGTIYQGGYFKAQLKFLNNYPYSPPTMRFLSNVWHPSFFWVVSHGLGPFRVFRMVLSGSAWFRIIWCLLSDLVPFRGVQGS